MQSLLQLVLAPQFESALKTPDPAGLVSLYDKDTATPAMVWDSNMREDVRAMVQRELKPIEKTIAAAEQAQVGLGLAGRAVRAAAFQCAAERWWRVCVSQFVAQPFFAVNRSLPACIVRWHRARAGLCHAARRQRER